MSRVWFSGDLETAATFWRVMRTDGVTLGFTTHDNDLWFGGVLHRAAPGMIPSAIRRSAGLEPDSAEVEGALAHEAIAADDLAAGRFDDAQVRIGLVDWQTRENVVLYRGKIGSVIEEDGRFAAELVSRKADLLVDPVPRTSPFCRAQFCGPGCTLSASRFTHEAVLTQMHPNTNEIVISAGAVPAVQFRGGFVRFREGPHAGSTTRVMAVRGSRLVLDIPLDDGFEIGMPLIVREGCDHTLTTCAERFGNAVNFQGEPFLPGNDLLTRYPVPA